MGVAYVLCSGTLLRGSRPAVAGSGMLSIFITLEALSLHGACTAVFVAVTAIISLIFCGIQTLDRITWLA
jgi:hypothetical protein